MARTTGGGGVVEQLREKMRASGESLNEISRASGVSVSQLSRFLRGQRMLTLPVAEKVAHALGLGLELVPGKAPARPRGKRQK